MELSAFFLQISVKTTVFAPRKPHCLGFGRNRGEKVRCGNQINSMNHGELFHHLQGDDES